MLESWFRESFSKKIGDNFMLSPMVLMIRVPDRRKGNELPVSLFSKIKGLLLRYSRFKKNNFVISIETRSPFKILIRLSAIGVNHDSGVVFVTRE